MDADPVEKSNSSGTGDNTMDVSPTNESNVSNDEVKKVQSVNSAPSSVKQGMEVDSKQQSEDIACSENSNNIVQEKDSCEMSSNGVEKMDTSENTEVKAKEESTSELNSASPHQPKNTENDSVLGSSGEPCAKEQSNENTTTEKTNGDHSVSAESVTNLTAVSSEGAAEKSIVVDVAREKDAPLNEVTSTENSTPVKIVGDLPEVSQSKNIDEALPKMDSVDQDNKRTETASENSDANATKDSDKSFQEAKEKDPVASPATPSPAMASPAISSPAVASPAISSPATASPASEGKSKKDGESGKKKKSKSCEECGTRKGLKFQVLFKGKTRFLCSDTCFKEFKTKQAQQKASEAAPKETTLTKETCFQCHKDILNNQAFYPIVGEIQALCSEECIKKHNKENLPAKSCSQCKRVLDKSQDLDVLTWETMLFCNEDCLGKFQSYLGSHCTCCQSPVPQPSLGKYSVCFGADIRQFCSCNCLDEFKKNLKVCSFCQTDLSAGIDSFLAPVGDKGQFKDFCSQNCMERYEVMNNISKSTPQSQMCTNCKKQGTFKIQVKHENESYSLCSDLCVAGFRWSRKIKDKMCDTCYNFFKMSPDKELSFKFDGSSKHFCTKACMTLFVLSHRKIVACASCKVKKYNFDMIEKTDASAQTHIFCSLNCLSLYRVSVNAVSSKNIRCDHCGKNMPAQYHLTMSDGSVRNFCSYNCVIVFQNQYTNVCTLTTTTASRQATVSVPTIKTTATGNTPVISNVVSLAPVPRGPAPIIRNLVPSKMVQTRPTLQSVAIIGSKTGVPALTPTSPLTNVTNTAGQQVIREVIVKPPAPKSQKNKSVACKPIMLNKGINVKPTPCHKAVQTDDSQMPVFVPIPIPVYIPTPLVMFSRPVPCPVPFPVPIPVPLLLPKELPSKGNAAAKVDEAVAEKALQENCVNKNDVSYYSKSLSENDESEENADEFISSSEYNDISDSTNDEHGMVDGKSSSKRPHPVSPHKAKSRKRTRMDDMVVEEAKTHIIPQPEENHHALRNDQSDAAPHLKHHFGVNAWKQWVLQKNDQMVKGSQSSRKFKLFKTDLLQLPPDELNYSLSLFVKEVRKPTGEEYGSGSIYYLCLGIQKYLFQNGRLDNIFAEPHYEKFTECLHDILQSQDTLAALEGLPSSRIDEEVLWESKQLGAHSPYALLNTLMYFNTKYFKLKKVDDHMRLSFTHVDIIWVESPRLGFGKIAHLRYYPKEPRKDTGDLPYYEQKENTIDHLRCPVKLYEFYLSKIPESCKGRNDLFYLTPDRSCCPDSAVWYSAQSLGQDIVSKMIQRIKIVREIHEP